MSKGMSTTIETETRFRGLGMTSTVLGTIGLMFFFLPILGMPISICGVAAGILGSITALLFRGRLRWSVAGMAISLTALAINIAISYAPRYLGN
jgi:hypothetical protein